MRPDRLHITGLRDAADMRKLLADVRANHAKLEACAYHEFDRIGASQPQSMRDRYRCRHCGGEVDFHGWFWHEQGRRPRPMS